MRLINCVGDVSVLETIQEDFLNCETGGNSIVLIIKTIVIASANFEVHKTL